MSRPVRCFGAIAVCALAALIPAAPASAADSGCTRVAARDGSDTAAGTAAAPFKTAYKLVSSLRSGETGCLRAGAYTETSNGYVAKLAVPNVTLRSYAGERARLVGIVYVPSTGSGVRLSSLDFEGTGLSNTIKIYAADVVVEDSDITNASRGQSCMMLGSNSSGVGAAIRPVIRRNLFHACGNPANGNKDHGIYASNVDSGEIVDNVFHDPSAYAMQLYPNSRNTRFAHNVVDGGQTVRGGVVFGGDSSYASNDNLVEHNVLTYAATYGIQTSWGGAVGYGNVARSNCIYGAKYGSFSSQNGFIAIDNLTADPRFADRAAHDYRLAQSSPCLSVVGYDTAAKLAGILVSTEPTTTEPTTTEPTTTEPTTTEPTTTEPTTTEPTTTEPTTTEPTTTEPAPTVNLAPTVTLTSPLDGTTFTGTLAMAADATDDGAVAKVEFYVDGKLRATDESAPYTAKYTLSVKKARGTHKVTAKAYDTAGLASAATVTVSGG